MPDNLWPQLRLQADTEAELVEKYRQVYLDTYVRDHHGQPIVLADWASCAYRFGAYAFEHAFTESKNYKIGAGVHDGGFSPRRARRILWIKEALALSRGTVQRYIQSRKSDRGYQKKRLVLVVLEERYVIVFNDPQRAGKRHEFLTAFPADMNYLERIKRQSFLAETVSARKPGE